MTGALAQDSGTEDFWDGFYLGVLGGGGSNETGTVSLLAGTGMAVNSAFYFGAEAFLAAESVNNGEPFLWLGADGRLGAQVTDTMLLFTSAGLAYDSSASEIAITGGGGAEVALNDAVMLRAQYSVRYYPGGLGTTHKGLAGVIFRFD